MNRDSIPGLRIFLYTIVDLISQGKSETCANMENLMQKGVASKLHTLYTPFFDQNGLNADNIPHIDEYFRQWSGVADDQEMRKYHCTPDDGLALIVKLALNEIF